MSDKLAGSLQENLLTLLTFSERYHAMVRNVLDVSLFSSDIYRDIVTRVYDYIDTYHKPPREHLPDLFDDILRNPAHKQRPHYEDLLRSAYELSSGLNEEYVVSQLEKFSRQQQLKIGIIEAGDAVQAGDLDAAEGFLEAALKRKLGMFSRGITLEEGLQMLSASEDLGDTVPTGIKELDMRNLGPTRKELHLFIARPKGGKTWWATHIAKRALMSRWRVLVVSLEISEKIYAMRLLQAFFGVGKRKAQHIVTKLERDRLGRLIELHCEERIPADTFDNDKTFGKLRKKLEDIHGRKRLLIKNFPTGALNISGLRAYLDSLERMENFVPDIVLLDYADLMKVDSKNYRVDLGILYKDLRGIAVERNLAMATMSQANRAGAGARLITDIHAAEDFSKIATADCVLTYNQTPAEKALGLARLFISNARNDEDKFMVLITQAYTTGQFALDSVRMSDSYWEHIEAAARDQAAYHPPGSDSEEVES